VHEIWPYLGRSNERIAAWPTFGVDWRPQTPWMVGFLGLERFC
jgi:hypothetical protein